MRLPRGKILGLLCATLVSLALSASAKRAEADARFDLGGESLDVDAEELDLDWKAGTALLSGGVSLVRGELNVRCPKLLIRFDDGPEVRLAEGSGGVRAELRDMVAEAPSARLDFRNNRLDLHGGVKLSRGEARLQAASASVDLESARISLKGVRGSIPVREIK